MDSLDVLQAEMRACRLCLEAGYEIAPGAVFSGGPEAQVMVVGQAPGVTEAEVKRPFNASSGTRLFQWLGEAGWEEEAFRARHYMTAVTKCYPGKAGNGKGDRVPTKAEQKLCRPFLEQEMALVNPRLIIPVGGLAIKLFYPAKLRLNQVVGTAVYYPPDTLSNPVNFNLEDAQSVQWAGEWFSVSGENLADLKPQDGRFLVPLPHPSGASLWPNKPANQRLIAQAIQILRQIRVQFDL